ncbi:MAG: ubiquitin-like domain-containing protein [Candidatus Promineifilaceae bacterium]
MAMPHLPLRLRPLSLVIVAVLGLVCLLTLTLVMASSRYVVYADDQVRRISGQYNTVGQVLEAAGVQVRPEDVVVPAESAAADPGSAIRVSRALSVTVRTEETTRTYWTAQSNLASFLTEAGIVVDRTDQLAADGKAVSQASLSETPLPKLLEIGQFTEVSIHDGANTISVRTSSQTVGEALAEAGLVIYAADGVDPSLGSWLSPGMEITVRRSVPLTIYVDGRVIQTRSHHTNSLDVLAETGVGLIGQDYVRPSPETELKAGDTIQVVRVTEDYRIVDDPIPYETLWQGTDELELDQRALLSPGVPGIMRRRIRIRYENGVETAQIPDGEWIAREPVAEVIGYGTRIVTRVLDTPEGAFEYWRVVRMRVTSYTAASSGKPPEHPAYGITASGLQAGTGIVAVDRNVVPFRTWVYVPGYGLGFAGDTGGGVKGRWIDLGYDEGKYQSWHGYTEVYYLTPVPPPDKINYLIPTALP